MDKKKTEIKKPSLFFFLTEFIRALYESFRARLFIKKYKAQAIGDGHPVFVIPGFMATDLSTGLLRKFLKKIGFTPYPWGLGRNYADLEEVNLLEDKLVDMYEKHKAQVTLIGWSLGGIYARQLSRLRPEMVDQLITLGSPYMGVTEPNRAQLTYRMVKRGEKISEVTEDWVKRLQEHISVPSTAIYSKSDGIVSWKVCREDSDRPMHKNIEVKSSHIGMGMNKSVLKIIAELLLNPLRRSTDREAVPGFKAIQE